MSPYEQSKAIYESKEAGMSFEWYVAEHHKRGFVYSSPSYFVAALRVRLEDLRAGIHPIECGDEGADTWYISVMVGDVADALTIPKARLAWFAYHRDDEKGLHVIPFDRIALTAAA